MTDIDEIKQRLDIVDFIGSYVKLKKAGRNFKATCPFHSEKTPSFMISPERQIWYCFGHGEGGDIFSFLMKIEGLDFLDALEILAKKSGVKLSKVSKKNDISKTPEINRYALAFYHKILKESNIGKEAREYLLGRGFLEKTIDDFFIGFSPDSRSEMSLFLGQKGYSLKEIVESGIAYEKDGRLIDRFYNRIMFPIIDQKNNVVGFGGRILPSNVNKDLAKYINSPETRFFSKGSLLYGFGRAISSIKENGAIISEGYLDVIKAHQEGFTNVVGTLGTALTEEHITLLKRLTNRIFLAFDLDAAGKNATTRAIELAKEKGIEIKVIKFAHGKDIDEAISVDKNEVSNAINNAVWVTDYYFDEALLENDPNTIIGKKKLSQILLPAVSELSDPIERAHYIRKLSTLFHVSENDVRLALLKHSKKPESVKEISLVKINVKPEDYLIGLALAFPSHIEYILSHISLEYIDDQVAKQLFALFPTWAGKDRSTIVENIKTLPQEISWRASFLALRAEEEFSKSDVKAIIDVIKQMVNRLKNDYKEKARKNLQIQLQDAEKKGDLAEVKIILEKFKEVS